MREPKLEREEELLKMGRPNRYTSKSERTYDYVVFEGDLGRQSVEEVLNNWLKRGKITGAVYVKHDRDRYSRLDTLDGKNIGMEGKLKTAHYHILVQFKDPHSKENAWLEFRDFLNTDSRNKLSLDFERYKLGEQKVDICFPIYDIRNRAKYYMHNNKAYGTSYNQKDLHQLGSLAEEQTNEYGAIEGMEVNVNDENYNFKKNKYFFVYAEEDLRECSELAENIANICSAVRGKLYLDAETGKEFMLECREPKTLESVAFLLNVKHNGQNVGLPTNIFLAGYDTIQPLFDGAKPEEFFEQGFYTFNGNDKKNKEVYEHINNMEKDGY